MPFEKGNKKSGGRPVGSKSKIVRLKVSEILDSLGFEPFKELVWFAKKAKSEKLRLKATIELCQYLAPKLKQVDFKTDSKEPISIVLNMLPSTNKTSEIIINPKLDDLEHEEKESREICDT